HHQGGLEAGGAAGGAALVLTVVVALDILLGLPQHRAYSGPGGAAAIAGELSEHLRQRARKRRTAFAGALAVDHHLGRIAALRYRTITLDALRGGSETGCQHRCNAPQQEPSRQQRTASAATCRPAI